MSRLHINIGNTANDRTGDPLRTAFDKVNQNFIELYATAGADVQIPTQTNNGGKFLTTNGTTLSWSSISQEVGTGNTGFVDDKIYNLNGLELGNDDLIHGATARLSLPANGDGTEVSLLNYYGGVGIYTGFNPSEGQGWTFGNNGTFTLPSISTRSFVAVLDTAHMYPQPGIAFEGAPWELPVQFQLQPDGTIETIIAQTFPRIDNPGYVTGHTFRFEEADHGLPGFTFDIQLNDVVLPGGAGWTANLTVSQPPAYRPTIESPGPIKIKAGPENLVFGTDGNLQLPGRIIFPNGTASVYGNTDLIGLFPSPTSNSGIEIATGGDASIFNAGDVVITSNWQQEGGAKDWTFSPTGTLTLPVAGSINSVIDNPIVLKTSKNVVGGTETATNSNPTPSNVFFGYLGFTPSINNVQVGWTVSGDGLVGTKTVTNVALGGFENGYWTITVDGTDGSAFTYNGTYTFSQTSATVTNQWDFGDDGILTLPVGGDIVDSTGTSVLGTPTVIDGGNASTTF